MLTLDSIIQRDPEIIAAEADKDLIMVSIATGSYYGLSDVARAIWEAIERPKRISDLIDDLTASYQIDSSSCEEQTLSFLEALLNEGLLGEDGPAASSGLDQAEKKFFFEASFLLLLNSFVRASPSNISTSFVLVERRHSGQ
jgi:hypothetical protein